MADPNLRVMGKEARGLDVNDITGNRKNNKGGSAHPPISSERAVPVKPRMMEYDIINPTTNEGRLRMSQYGKNVVSSR